ncbi:DUF3182 family protein [Actinomycetospora termitidis]|uniref:DUF3182 family protein n=1 Tax=Actinomycetospora termitidis TaxID=3053470 RepID=A0ABT7MK07_9PSEU|nr:DUF3182 family protein [Actinomycetospora sp. Odt1-22]MDL5160529.1 DUF3182 family protein [Actinomycetospora sp. Odt1-22]
METEYLSGIEARDRGLVDLCAEIVPDGYRVVIAHEAVATEDLCEYRPGSDPVDADGTPLWIYGSTLPRALLERTSKVQVHEPFDESEVPAWFDLGFPRHLRGTTVPGYSCFSPDSLAAAARELLDEFVAVRLKDPNGASGVGQWTIRDAGNLESVLAEVAEDIGTSCDVELTEYLAHYGYVVEADIDDVEAWSVTLTRMPDGCYSSFGRILEMTVDLEVRGTVQNYGGTSVVVVRGDPDALEDLPDDGVVVDDPVRHEEIRLAPPPGVVRAAQRFIEGMRAWEPEGVVETRANVDVITGKLARRDGSRTEIAASVEESARVGGASSAELLGILALREDAALSHSVRSSRHGFDDEAVAYARHAASVPGSRVFWNGVDEHWDGRYVFIGAY